MAAHAGATAYRRPKDPWLTADPVTPGMKGVITEARFDPETGRGKLLLLWKGQGRPAKHPWIAYGRWELVRELWHLFSGREVVFVPNVPGCLDGGGGLLLTEDLETEVTAIADYEWRMQFTRDGLDPLERKARFGSHHPDLRNPAYREYRQAWEQELADYERRKART